jgi:hypothetical protein
MVLKKGYTDKLAARGYTVLFGLTKKNYNIGLNGYLHREDGPAEVGILTSSPIIWCIQSFKESRVHVCRDSY